MGTHKHARHVSALGAIMLVMIGVVGCSSGSSTTGSSSTVAPAATTAPVDTLAPPTVVQSKNATVRVIDNDFDPKNLQVKAGTKVSFLEVGHNRHNIIPDDPSKLNFSVTEDELTLGSTHTFTFAKPGVYAYYCSLHATPTAGTMRGVITVTR